MKVKTIEKKLFLNKKTVANLANDELNAVKGGVPSYPACDSIVGYTCNTDCRWSIIVVSCSYTA